MCIEKNFNKFYLFQIESKVCNSWFAYFRAYLGQSLGSDEFSPQTFLNLACGAYSTRSGSECNWWKYSLRIGKIGGCFSLHSYIWASNQGENWNFYVFGGQTSSKICTILANLKTAFSLLSLLVDRTIEGLFLIEKENQLPAVLS